jgi:hypothetical protein
MSDERRTNRRFPVPEGREKIELKIGRTLIRGRLVDVSAGGFAVEVAGDESLEAGAMLEMRTCDGSHLAQIARVYRRDDVTCLGLIRVEDVPLPEPKRRKGRRMARAGNPLFLIPVIVGIAVCAVTVCVACMGPEWTETTILNPASQSLTRVFNFEEGRKLRTRFGSESNPPSPAGGSPSSDPADPKKTDKIDGSWTAWSDYMELTADQFRELRARLSDRFEQMKPSQLNELPADGRQKIDDVLSADQKLRLKEFLASDKGR